MWGGGYNNPRVSALKTSVVGAGNEDCHQYSATSDDKVGIVAAIKFQWVFSGDLLQVDIIPVLRVYTYIYI